MQSPWRLLRHRRHRWRDAKIAVTPEIGVIQRTDFALKNGLATTDTCFSKHIPWNTAQNIAQNNAQNTSQNNAQNTAQNIAQNTSQNNAQNTTQNIA